MSRNSKSHTHKEAIKNGKALYGDAGDSNDDDDSSYDEYEEEEADEEEYTHRSDQNAIDKQVVTLCPSLFGGRPGTVYFEYVPTLGVFRPGAQVDMSAKSMTIRFKCGWERLCIKHTCAMAGLKRTKSSNFNLYWGKHLNYNAGKFTQVHEFQKVNHLPRSWIIGRKDRLLRLISLAQTLFGDTEYDFLPEGFILPDQTHELMTAARDTKAGKLWILKPCASSCGKGIKLLTQTQLLGGGLPLRRRWVCHRYLSKPLLVNERKFDLRLYVLVAGVDPLRIYFFREGMTRFATSKYTRRYQDMDNVYMHLTNYSINKNSKDFVSSENIGRCTF